MNRRSLLSLAWLTIGVCSLLVGLELAAQESNTSEPTGKNLLQSSSFDSGQLQKGVPAGWIQSTWGGQPAFEFDRKQGHNENGSLKISSDQGANASWSQRVQVKPNRDYRLRGWVKTNKLDKGPGVGVVVNLHELQFDGRSKGLEGTQEWTRLEIEANSGNHDSLLVNLTFGGWGNATGTAWFDDIELVEVLDPIDMENETITEQEAIAFYNTKVKPILKANCFECHADDPEDLQGSFAITSHASIMRGGDSGPAVNPKQLRESILIRAINYDQYEMPPSGQLSKEEIGIMTRWVKLGMPFDPADEKDLTADLESHSTVPQVNAETKKFWSFQIVTRPDVPDVDPKQAWVKNPIDHFVLKRLEASSLSPAPQASKATLIRRVYYDLTGLPPSPEQVEAFINDPDPQAYSKLVDQLLASPHYGEKWGRHWLDLVRYAESNSFERDGTKPFVWRYRDYVIRAFNDDKPYDQFLLEQLAGDELENVTNESIIATGYYRLGAWDDEPADPKLARYDDLDDIVATTSQTIMGLTVNCARCHDHKIDPIPQKDYYRLAAMFENIRRYGVRSDESVFDASVKTLSGDATEEQKQTYAANLRRVDQSIDKIVALVKPDFESVEHEDFQYEMNQLAIVKKRVGKQITQKQFNRFRSLHNERKKLIESPPGSIRVLCVKERGAKADKSFVRIRGNPHVVGDEVEPGFISVLSPPEPVVRPVNDQSIGRRLTVAKWLVDPSHPLTARVMANRIWQFHFGRGIVRTTSDFGFQGSRPTHPELLDWLASEFVARKWSIKSMHRLMMNSAAYQMSSRFDESAFGKDPSNDLFWRFDLRRLTAEEIRDSILEVTGQLNREKMYGPSIFPTMPAEVLAGQSRPGKGWGRSSDEDKRRRSVYVHIKRSLGLPILSVHDSADTDNTCPVRFITTQSTQALGMMNSEFTNDQARKFAVDIEAKNLDSIEAKVTAILRRVMQRQPTSSEVARGLKLIEQWRTEDKVSAKQALEYYCLLALNLNEFIYVD
ncbi:MAG: PSD1 and planctomycete cytochrome C domain-containing protein [Planctomycetota bacterium]